MSARTRSAAAAAIAAVVVSACTEEPPEPTNHAVEGGVACEFLSVDVVEDAVGRDIDGLDVVGSSESEGRSSCVVTVPEGEPLLRVDADPTWPDDPGLPDLLATMRQDNVTMLTDEIGYSATGTPEVDHEGDEPGWGSASVLHGDWRVYVILWESEWAELDGRENVAVDLMHTVIDVLELGPEWTYDEAPPAGLEAPGAAS